jgi:hypothetical protein
LAELEPTISRLGGGCDDRVALNRLPRRVISGDERISHPLCQAYDQGDQSGRIFHIQVVFSGQTITEVNSPHGLLFSTVKVMHIFYKKGLGNILGHFSRTHLVTLLLIPQCKKC